ncbi:MAG: hypothetical protein RQ826_02420 [Xanthomonadales bacterium]|nr:hypothetical protein [Xanthomonadales bacterium]
MKVSSRTDEIHYRLNDRDEIVYVNEVWDLFALANSGEHLTATRVLGRPLWDFITDDTSRRLYRVVLAKVRDDRPVRFDFRCDSPDCRRLLEMEVSRGQHGSTEFRVRTLAKEKRQPQALLDPYRPPSGELLCVCAWCKRVDMGDRWTEVEEAVSLLGLPERSLLPEVTHGICEDCNARMVATLSDIEQGAKPVAPAGSGKNPGSS